MVGERLKRALVVASVMVVAMAGSPDPSDAATSGGMIPSFEGRLIDLSN